MAKIGIFGGTFNPVHIIHIGMALQFINRINLDFCIFVPANFSPFKTANEEFQIPAEHRVKMLTLALEKFDNLILDTCEIDRKGISYTIDTLRYMKNRYQSAGFHLLLGSDQLNDFTKWKNWEEIVKITKICVVHRSDFKIEDTSFITQKGKEIQLIDMPESDISSSKIRKMVRNNESISGLVPRNVEDYIIQNKLYRN